MRRVAAAVVLLAAMCGAAWAQSIIPPIQRPDPFSTIRPDPEIWRSCRPIEVAAFENRVHLRCYTHTPGGGLQSAPDQASNPLAYSIAYYAVGARADPALADRVIALATSAIARNKRLTIFFRSDPAENPPGCLTHDCRRLTGIVLLE